MSKSVGILTAGGDSPGLNAAIRAVGKILNESEYSLIGFRDGFEGVAFDRTIRLDEHSVSGILTVGGTILHTSRNKPHKMPIGEEIIDMTDVIVENYQKHQLECLICIGGGG
ncbi:MAG: 6-phosphofructokinase, partial [Victivallales bacterium]|nr:6-phosphofructokinase [Victivallales bacterium]